MQRAKAAGERKAVESVSPEQESPRLESDGDAARKRAAVETYLHNEATLQRIARRYSLCADDAEDALQRGLEILLRKPPSDDPRALIKWTQTVVKHEAMAVRREREQILAGPAAMAPDRGYDWVSLLPASGDGPPERAERREAVARSREALQALKPQELRALTLLAEGYSYVEIGEITGYSHTKINRCLAEGRERFRKLLAHSEEGGRCAELQPLLSAFCDGEADGEEVTALREHLRACPSCRATLRAYRAAPAAAAALAPTLPVDRSLLERAHDALTGFAARFGGGGDAAASQAAASGGSRGAGVAALAKLATICIGTAGGAAACVATGLVPAPLDPSPGHDRVPRLERHSEAPAPEATVPQVEYAPVPEPVATDSEPKEQTRTHDETPAEAEPATSEPASSSGAVEYAPPPEPAPEPAPTASSGGGNPAGEFGP
jgi:RNA polymerase sigma factor (sigma-70 family)